MIEGSDDRPLNPVKRMIGKNKKMGSIVEKTH